MEDTTEKTEATGWEEIAAAGAARRALTANIYGDLVVLLRDGEVVPPPTDPEEQRKHYGVRRRQPGYGWRAASREELAEIADGNVAAIVLALPGMLKGMAAAAARAKGQTDHRLAMTPEEKASFAFPCSVRGDLTPQVRGALPVVRGAIGDLLREVSGEWPQKDYGRKYNIGVARPDVHFYLEMAILELRSLARLLERL